MCAAFFGSRQIDIDVSSTVPNLLQPTRHYERVTDLVREIIEARIWVGFHYRGSMTTGVNVGRKVARWALARYFHPIDDDDDDNCDDRLKPSLPVTR